MKLILTIRDCKMSGVGFPNQYIRITTPRISQINEPEK
jgi:hypothetical protein